MRFIELRQYVSRIDRISVCLVETLEYKNFLRIAEVPSKWDDYYIHGIGIIDSEFPEKKGETLKRCIEIMVSEKEKK